MPAAEVLQRILYILPAAAREGGVTLAELAQALDVDAATIINDLEHVTARAYYHPAATVDPFTILIEDDRVFVYSSDEFKRPTRLTVQEALALGLGLRTLAAENDEPRRSEILSLAQRLESALTAPKVDVQPRLREAAEPFTLEEQPSAYVSIELEEDDTRGIIAGAIEAQRLCRIKYVKPGEDAPYERRVAPQRLVYANGRWYVAAFDVERGEARLFRLDRIMTIAALDERADPEQLSAVGQRVDRKQYSLWPEEDMDVEVTVRYSQRIARWISERELVQAGPDGTVRVNHQVSDPKWLVRHVLQYGGDAVVESPPYRRLVADAARRLSA